MMMRRWIVGLLALGASGLCVAQASPAADCEGIRQSADSALRWKPVAKGLDVATMEGGSARMKDLTLVRYANGLFRARAFDMRDLVGENRSRGLYSPPLFSINELRRNHPQATVVASAGMTRSFSEPVPAGFLRVNGTTKSPVAPKDKVLDGVVCVADNGRVSLLSEMQGSARRAPRNIGAACHSGFQAGPMLVVDGRPTPLEDRVQTLRVALGLTSDDSTVLVFSTSATTAALGCALTAGKIALTSAIGLQSDTLGGVGLGAAFESKSPLGNIDATIASALIVEARGPARASRR